MLNKSTIVCKIVQMSKAHLPHFLEGILQIIHTYDSLYFAHAKPRANNLSAVIILIVTDKWRSKNTRAPVDGSMTERGGSFRQITQARAFVTLVGTHVPTND